MQAAERPHVHPRRFTRAEYERLLDAGVLGPEDRVELIEGEILVMSPEKSRHAAAIDIVAEVLRGVFGPGHTIRVQHPLALDTWSEPEPDVCVVTGAPRDYVAAHPSTALLVVEVADSSLAFDRSTKVALYAAARLPDYWIVNLVDRCVEVYRDPDGAKYRQVARFGERDTVSPLAATASMIEVAELLP